ncbi:SixA phosphatase family protein [Mesorhizobium xinjiangense]|uniref:SixA phosphatase family protein n=1 Tax=Mesorhizobium xinjiangense TaxID=2678685 RepID=UPI0012ECF8D4|nr:histidine phosphatase family protein [Mesorhizobium xinjiangense]
MSRLFLLRHAKAAWPEPGGRDFDRPLSPSGAAEAGLIGQAMLRLGLMPRHVVCSPAARAVQTWQAIAESLARSAAEAFLSDSLYDGDASSYLTLIRNAGPVGDILVVGHNPMIEDVAAALSENGDAAARSMLAKGFPTGGLAVINIAGDPPAASPATCRLERFLIPSEL